MSRRRAIAAAAVVCLVAVGAIAALTVPRLLAQGRVRRAYFGMGGATVPISRRVARFLAIEQATAVKVAEVQAQSPAALGGLKPDDLVVGIDGEPVRSVDDLHRLLDETRIGKPLVVRVLRGTQPLYLHVQPTESVPTASKA